MGLSINLTAVYILTQRSMQWINATVTASCSRHV